MSANKLCGIPDKKAAHACEQTEMRTRERNRGEEGSVDGSAPVKWINRGTQNTAKIIPAPPTIVETVEA